MMKIDKTVKKETVYIAVWVLILSVLLQAVFLLLGKWELSVLFGNLYGAAAAVLNFFLLGLGVQRAVAKADPEESKKTVRLSQSLRFLMLVLLIGAGVAMPWFHSVALVIPLLFPRIGLLFRPKFRGMDQDEEGGA